MADRRRTLRRLSVPLAAWLWLAAATAAAADFVPGIEDLPLAPGLVAVDETATEFDTPAGRIVTAEARGQRVSEAEIRRFYAESLVALGWRARDELHYEREGERLALAFRRSGGALIVRFEIRPR